MFDFHYVFGPRGMSMAELVLIEQLDYEKQNLYTLTLLAIVSDQEMPLTTLVIIALVQNAQSNEEFDTRNVHTVQLSIVVKDVQDSPPVFHNLPRYVAIDNTHRMVCPSPFTELI